MKETTKHDIYDNPKKSFIIAIIFIVAGIVMSYQSVIYINSYNKKTGSFIETKAQVVDYENDHSDYPYSAIVEYTVDGKAYRLTSDVKTNYPKNKGTYVYIKYNPNNPEDAIFVSNKNLIIYPASSLVFFSLGAFLLYDRNKKTKERK